LHGKSGAYFYIYYSGKRMPLDDVKFDEKIISKLEKIKKRYEGISLQLSQPDIVNDNNLFRTLSKEMATYDDSYNIYKQYNELINQYIDTEEMLKGNDKEIKELAEIGKKLQQHYLFPQDVEWAIEKGRIYIVQTRPITTIADVKEKGTDNIVKESLPKILTGSSASPGMATGNVKIVHSPKEISKVLPGDILVAQMTSPDYVPAMRKAAAIVTDRGGATSHAAIVSRELGIPCVVGTEKATKVLKEYLALVYDPIKRSEGEISLPIQKGKVKTKVMPRGSENEATRIKTAVTFFEVFQLFQHYTLLKVRINTGRTHQIRAHLSFYGHSVVGDRKYCHPRYINRTAFTKFIKFDRVFLHASTIGFFDCTSKWRQYQADLPAELTDFLKTLSG